ncbi:MAG: sulfatase [Pseudomonadota bacterium]
MKTHRYIQHVLNILVASLVCCTVYADKPNLIVITMDDMNWDSMGAYGSPIENITPHMDQMAAEGMRFEHAYMVAASCVPSRNALMSGRHSNVSGVMGFYNVESGHFQTLPEVLRSNGYYTAVVHKPRDSSLNDDYDDFWDYHRTIPADDKRNAPKVGQEISTFIAEAKKSNKPFFCVINIADPHQPFFGGPKQDQGGSFVPPTKIYTADEIEVPAFLPDVPKIRKEMTDYYNSVKRGDDCVGAVVEALKREGVYDDAVVMFLSDHGMPLPYAKGSLFREGLRSPWVVRWPGKVKAGRVESDQIISAVDLMPTLLDIADAPVPKGVQGQSFLPVIEGKQHEGREYVFAQYNENAGGLMFPTRSIQNKRYNYIFSPWSDGSTEFVTASTWTAAYGTMKRLSETDAAIRKRFQHWVYRSVEELYDHEKDPHALNNVIDDPAYADVVKQMRSEMETWMRGSDDYVLEAFLKRNDAAFLKQWMAEQDAEAVKRAETLQWKRYKNRSGGTGKRTDRYVPRAD